MRAGYLVAELKKSDLPKSHMIIPVGRIEELL
jgi:hypothetical protein